MRRRRNAAGQQVLGDLYAGAADWWAAVAALPRIDLGSLAIADGPQRTIDVRCAGTQDLRLERGRRQRDVSFEPIAARLRQWTKEGERVFLVASTEAQAHRLIQLLSSHELETSVLRDA